MNVNDYITHIDNHEDLPFLKNNLFNVDMRLFRSSRPYRKIVLRCCNYIKFLCSTEMKGYKKPHGMSGANAAIPFNIIAYVTNRNTKDENVAIMINPKINYLSAEKIRTFSNCGSIRLKEPIEIERSKTITLAWHDMQGYEHYGSFDRTHGGLTIQHEVDHNLGILITDRIVKNKSKIEESII